MMTYKIFTEIIDKNPCDPCVKSQSKIYVIIKKIFNEIMNKKSVLNHSEKFMPS